jgi:hypothetical protein
MVLFRSKATAFSSSPCLVQPETPASLVYRDNVVTSIDKSNTIKAYRDNVVTNINQDVPTRNWVEALGRELELLEFSSFLQFE